MMEGKLMLAAALALLALGCGVEAQQYHNYSPRGYYGRSLRSVQIECVSSSECPQNQACDNQKCIHLCALACGENANCDVRQQVPQCFCPPRYTGNPYTECRLLESE